MKQKKIKTTKKKRGRRKLKPVDRRLHDKLLVDLHDTSEKLFSTEKMRQRQDEYIRERETHLENELAFSYEEQARLNTVISSLGKHIQDQERIIRRRNRIFNSLQAESTNNYSNQPTITQNP